MTRGKQLFSGVVLVAIGCTTAVLGAMALGCVVAAVGIVFAGVA